MVCDHDMHGYKRVEEYSLSTINVSPCSFIMNTPNNLNQHTPYHLNQHTPYHLNQHTPYHLNPGTVMVQWFEPRLRQG